MTIYCVDDGGDGTQTNTTQAAGTLDWSKADTSIANLLLYDAAALTTSGNIIYIGDDHNDSVTGAHRTFTGPTSGLPVVLISADRTQATPTYKVGTGDQLKSSDGAFNLILDGSFALYGVRLESGAVLQMQPDANETFLTDECTFSLPVGQALYISGSSGTDRTRHVHSNMTVNLIDSTNQSGFVLYTYYADCKISGLTFTGTGAPFRTGTVWLAGTTLGDATIEGADFSGFTNATACEIVNAASASHRMVFSNCLTAATWSPFTGTPIAGGRIEFANCGPADAPTYLAVREYLGDLLSSSSIYRTGGASVEGDATSWLITTTANCAEGAPFYTPWIYGTVSTTGAKTFDLYITNDTADFTDAECWLEVEYLATSDSAQWSLATDHRATITTTAAAQDDDTTSTWNGTGPAFTYKQKLSVPATIGETGQYRARVAVGVASIASSRYFYVDPKVTVS